MIFLIKTTAIARLSLPVYQNLTRNIVVSWLREKEGKRERSPRNPPPTDATETGEGGRVSQSVNRSGADAVECNAKVNGEEAEEAKGERKKAKERKGEREREREREREKSRGNHHRPSPSVTEGHQQKNQ